MPADGPTRVIGVGNPDRGDDGAGVAVARRLRDLARPGVEVLESGGDALSVLGAVRGAGRVILVDAIRSGAAPGSVRRIGGDADLLSSALRAGSSHDLGPAEALGLARALGELPERVEVIGIEGADFAPGAGLSPEVERAVDEVARQIRLEV